MSERETVFYLGEGGTVIGMDLPLPEVMQDKVTKGYLRRVNADGSAFVEPAVVHEADRSAPEGQPVDEKPPAANASKAHWVGYAHRAHDVSVDDAEAMTKADLIELYGGSQG